MLSSPVRGTRDHQIKVALLPAAAFELGTLCGVPANDRDAQRQLDRKVSVICSMRAPFCYLRTDFSAPKSNSASTSRGMPTFLGSTSAMWRNPNAHWVRRVALEGPDRLVEGYWLAHPTSLAASEPVSPRRKPGENILLDRSTFLNQGT